jgi:putative ABC transport system permease protein
MFADVCSAAWYAVTTNRLRTLLTAGSIAVGIASVVVMASLARSSLVSLAHGLEAVGGAQLVVVFPKDARGPRTRYAGHLTMDDVEVLRGRIPHARWVAAQTLLGEQTIRARDRETAADVVAGDLKVASMLQLTVVAGRELSASDGEGATRVAWLSLAVADRLFASSAEAVGRPLRVGSDVYTVVGVLGPSPSFALGLGYDLDNMVFVPQNRTVAPHPSLILVGTAAKEHNPTVAAVITSILSARHHEADDFRVFDFAVRMEQFKRMLATIELLAGAIAAVALLAGAAGTTNVLMVSVHEQIREIGVRKALGATGGAVMRQLLLQAFLIATLGALAGLGAGWSGVRAAGAVVSRYQPGWVTVAAVQPTLLAVLLAFAVTGLAGLLPALKVGRMSILDCLRAGA